MSWEQAGASWELEQAGSELGVSWSKVGARGVIWE